MYIYMTYIYYITDLCAIYNLYIMYIYITKTYSHNDLRGSFQNMFKSYDIWYIFMLLKRTLNRSNPKETF